MVHYFIKAVKTGDKGKFKYQVGKQEPNKPDFMLKPMYMKRETAKKKADALNAKSKGGKGNRRGKMKKPDYESI